MFCYKRRKYWENPTPIGLICLKAAIFYTLYEIIISGWSQMIKSHKIATLNHEVSALVYATLEYYNGIFWEKEERKKMFLSCHPYQYLSVLGYQPPHNIKII